MGTACDGDIPGEPPGAALKRNHWRSSSSPLWTTKQASPRERPHTGFKQPVMAPSGARGKPSPWLGVMSHWEVGGGREKAKQCSRSLSPLGRNPPPAHSPLCEVCGRTFITLMALLRVNSHCSSTHELGWPLSWPCYLLFHSKSGAFSLQCVLPAGSHPSS